MRPILGRGDSADGIRALWERQKATYGQPTVRDSFIRSDNHDQDRATLLYGEAATYAANVVNFTLDGIPFLYNGQEIGDATPTNYPERTPIGWSMNSLQKATLAKYKKLFEIRKREAAITSGELIWLKNSAPDSLVTFLRKTGDEQVLVIVNLSNRKVRVTVDLMAADFMPSIGSLTGKRISTAFSPGMVSFPAPMGAFEALVLKRVAPAAKGNNN